MNHIDWYRLDETKPDKFDKYLTCDNYGSITIKSWDNYHKSFSMVSQKKKEARNVYFWAYLPELPEELKEVAEIDALKRQIAELQNKLMKKLGANSPEEVL